MQRLQRACWARRRRQPQPVLHLVHYFKLDSRCTFHCEFGSAVTIFSQAKSAPLIWCFMVWFSLRISTDFARRKDVWAPRRCIKLQNVLRKMGLFWTVFRNNESLYRSWTICLASIFLLRCTKLRCVCATKYCPTLEKNKKAIQHKGSFAVETRQLQWLTALSILWRTAALWRGRRVPKAYPQQKQTFAQRSQTTGQGKTSSQKMA